MATRGDRQGRRGKQSLSDSRGVETGGTEHLMGPCGKESEGTRRQRTGRKGRFCPEPLLLYLGSSKVEAGQGEKFGVGRFE